MRRLLVALMLLLAAGMPAHAQLSTQCPLASRLVHGPSYTVSTTDQCYWIVLDFAGPISISVPTPNSTFSSGYTVGLVPIGSGGVLNLSVMTDPQTGNRGTVNNANPLLLNAGQTIQLRIGSGPNWYGLISSTLPSNINITGPGPQCVHASSSGVLSGTGTDCGTIGTGGAIGSIQFNQGSNVLGGYGIGPSFSTAGGVFDLGNGLVTGLKLATGGAAFNLGPAAGDLAGTWPNLTLSVGAASRGVGNLGTCLGGTLPNPSALAASCVLTALGSPSGDLGGTTYSAPLVTGLQGFPIASGQPPIPNAALVWNGSAYVPVVQSPGLNQLTGAISAGPGTGSQIAALNPGVVSNANLANAPAATLKCNAGAAMAPPSDCPVTGGLAFNSGALQLATNLGTSQQLTVGTACWTIQNGLISTIVAGSCSSGTLLTADDGATILTGDDALTQLTAEGGTMATSCGAVKLLFNTPCNIVAWGVLKL